MNPIVLLRQRSRIKIPSPRQARSVPRRAIVWTSPTNISKRCGRMCTSQQSVVSYAFPRSQRIEVHHDIFDSYVGVRVYYLSEQYAIIFSTPYFKDISCCITHRINHHGFSSSRLRLHRRNTAFHYVTPISKYSFTIRGTTCATTPWIVPSTPCAPHWVIVSGAPNLPPYVSKVIYET